MPSSLASSTSRPSHWCSFATRRRACSSSFVIFGIVWSLLRKFMQMTGRNLGDVLGSADPAKGAIIDCREWQAPRTVTYAELDRAANALARGLLRRGLARGERVAILAANRYEFVAAYLGAMRAGLVAVPVNHKFPAAMLESVLADCAPRLVLVDAERR